MHGKPRVLISAYACEPHKGSEPGVGWHWALLIARFAEVWVITRANNRNLIESEIVRYPQAHLHFIFYDVPLILRFWKRRTRGLYLYYVIWQIGVLLCTRKLNRSFRFDIIHHVTLGNIVLPTWLPFLKIPFIWGPIGGFENVPDGFLHEYSVGAKVAHFARRVVTTSSRYNPLFRHLYGKAGVIIAKTRDTANSIPKSYMSKVVVSTDVAVDYRRVFDRHARLAQVIAVGRFDAWRGFSLLIKAFAEALKEMEGWKLVLIGEGRESHRLRRICEVLGLSEHIIFVGQVSREKYLRYLSESSICVNPALKEGGATVMFDAFRNSLPVVCMDVPGTSEIVDADCGIKIKLTNSRQAIEDLARALIRLASDSKLRRMMGAAGRKRIMEHYTWEKKGQFIRRVYEDILGRML